jgi:hypothetical protein
MKIKIIILAVVLGFAACKKVKDSSPDNEVEQSDTSFVLKYSSSFTSGPYGKVTGDVKIYKQEGKYILYLENFKSSSGPNLHVYLSKEETPVNYKDLGALKSLGGNQSYDININLDSNPYPYVCIHCVDYNHLFGYAKL